MKVRELIPLLMQAPPEAEFKVRTISDALPDPTTTPHCLTTAGEFILHIEITDEQEDYLLNPQGASDKENMKQIRQHLTSLYSEYYTLKEACKNQKTLKGSKLLNYLAEIGQHLTNAFAFLDDEE